MRPTPGRSPQAAQTRSFTNSALDVTLRAAGVTEVYLTGINTNYCVFATTLSAWEKAYQVRVVLDGVTSCDGEAGHKEGVQMLDKFFVDYSSTTRVQLVRSEDIPHSGARGGDERAHYRGV